ncbi:MAG: TSCPD domain-containing protein, partial [Ruminococcus sp.]|nr:TSCPD domain-containing protein [Ruminococcus sp.]
MRIHNISFDGGCNGNLKAISRLCDGMTADEIA